MFKKKPSQKFSRVSSKCYEHFDECLNYLNK